MRCSTSTPSTSTTAPPSTTRSRSPTPRNPSQSLSALLDPLDGTLLSNDLRHTTALTFDGTTPLARNLDLADGIHSKVKQLGTHLEWDLGDGLTLNNRMRFVDADVDYTALFSGAAPYDAGAYLTTQLGRARSGFGARVARVRLRHHPHWRRLRSGHGRRPGAGERPVERAHPSAHAVRRPAPEQGVRRHGAGPAHAHRPASTCSTSNTPRTGCRTPC